MRLGLGRLNEPGSGFMIFWSGVGLVILAAALAYWAWTSAASGSLASLWSGLQWQKAPFVTALLVAYAVSLEALGFPIATVLLLVVLFRSAERQSWSVSVFGSVAATAFAYVVFSKWLGAQLPTGAAPIERLLPWSS